VKGPNVWRWWLTIMASTTLHNYRICARSLMRISGGRLLFTGMPVPVMGKRRSLWLTFVLSRTLPLLDNMATTLGDKGPVDPSLPVEDFSLLVEVLSQLTKCLNLLVEVVVVVLLLHLLRHPSVLSVVRFVILLMRAQIVTWLVSIV